MRYLLGFGFFGNEIFNSFGVQRPHGPLPPAGRAAVRLRDLFLPDDYGSSVFVDECGTGA